MDVAVPVHPGHGDAAFLRRRGVKAWHKGHDIEVIARGANISDEQAQYRDASSAMDLSSDVLAVLVNNDGIQRDVANSKEFGTGGYRSQKLERIFDTAHFVDSKLSRMVQLADMSAFFLRRRATIRSERDPRLEQVMARLSKRVTDAMPEPTGQYYTIR